MAAATIVAAASPAHAALTSNVFATTFEPLVLSVRAPGSPLGGNLDGDPVITQLFSLQSVDLALGQFNLPLSGDNWDILVTGHLSGGGETSRTVHLSYDFTPIVFDSTWTNLEDVTFTMPSTEGNFVTYPGDPTLYAITGYLALDNIHFDNGSVEDFEDEPVGVPFADYADIDDLHLQIWQGAIYGPSNALDFPLQDPNAPIPEPASWAMMLLGFGGLGAMLRRSRRQTRAVVA